MRFLIFELQNVCYNSYIYFAESLGQCLIDLGHTVDFFRIYEEPFDNIERFAGTAYDAIIDFNSDLPRALMDDDSFFLDHIDGPFFDFILDHPLYHNETLKNEIKNFNVICLDKNHKSYIQQYYPHIKNVEVCYMTGSLAFSHDTIDWSNWSDRDYDLVFSGSYTDPKKMENSILQCPKNIKEETKNIIDILLQDQNKTIENVMDELYPNTFFNYIHSNQSLSSQSFYLADGYVRSLNRKMLIQELDKCSHTLHLYGSCWNELQLHNAIVHREMPFNLSFTLFLKSKISVNILPNFKNGAHDRIFSGQLNGAVSLTDSSIALKDEYKHMQNILFYELDSLSGLSEKVDHYLDDNESLIKIAQAGNVIANQNHTWANISESLIATLNKQD